MAFLGSFLTSVVVVVAVLLGVVGPAAAAVKVTVTPSVVRQGDVAVIVPFTGTLAPVQPEVTGSASVTNSTLTPCGMAHVPEPSQNRVRSRY